MKSLQQLGLALILAAGEGVAGTITLDSQAGLSTNMPGVFTVPVTPHPSWQPNNPANPGDPADHAAVWISYADTGYGGSVFQPYQGNTPVVSIYQPFDSAAGMLSLKVWADDTVDVKLDGNLLFSAVFTQSTCAGQPIGCRPQDAGIFNVALTEGGHMLEFVLYQVGTKTNTTDNPMGLMFSGTAPEMVIPPSEIPEPTSAFLLGSGLLLLAVGAKKFRR